MDEQHHDARAVEFAAVLCSAKVDQAVRASPGA